MNRLRANNPIDRLLCALTWLFSGITFLSLLSIIGYVIIRGLPHIEPALFQLHYTTENVSLMPAFLTTVMVILISLGVAAPIGIFSAIYLVEYAKRGHPLVRVLRVTIETLAGIPSIVYGLFGLLFFVTWLGWGFSILAGSLTLSIMILPLIIRTTEESLKAIPDSYREGAFALGSGRLRTVFCVVLPAAAPGILSGIILSVGRIVGESAALIYTAGTVPKIPNSVFESGRTLAIHMYALSGEGFYTDKAYATALVLLLLVLGINALSTRIAKKIVKG